MRRKIEAFVGGAIFLVCVAATAIVLLLMGTRSDHATPANDDASYAPGSGANGPVLTANTIADTTFDPDNNPQQQTAGQRVVLQNASLDIVVEDVPGTVQFVSELATTHGGWVVRANVSRNRSFTRGNVEMRVPSSALDTVTDAIKVVADEVDFESRTGQDVTADYVDIGSRLRNLRVTEQQLLALIATATNVNDTLAVQRELNSTTSEIEVLQGRLNFYDSASAFSTVRIDVSEPNDTAFDGGENWRFSEVVDFSLNALALFAIMIVSVLTFVVIAILPIVAVIMGGYVVLWHVYLKRRRARRQPGFVIPSGNGEDEPPPDAT